MNMKTFSIRHFFPIQAPAKLPRTVFRPRALQVGVHTDCVQEEAQGLRCLPMIWATRVVEGVSIRLDILIWEFWAIWEHPPMLLECGLILRRLLVRHNLVILQ